MQDTNLHQPDRVAAREATLSKKFEKKDLALAALFVKRQEAEAAIQTLKKNGFSNYDISLLAPEKNGRRDFVYQQTNSVKMGAVIGAAIGFSLMGIVGVVVGLNEPKVLGMPPWLLTSTLGPIIGLILGAACGALVGIGSPKTAAHRYRFYLKEGGIVVLLHLNSEEERALASPILERSGGQDIEMLEEGEVWSTVVPDNRSPRFN